MNCEETKRLSSQYIDDVLSLPVRVGFEAHLDTCPVCRAEVLQLRSLSRSLAQLRPELPAADLVSAINDALMIEAAARRQSPKRSIGDTIRQWLEPRWMPYTIGSFASIILFVSMFAGFRPHFIALQEAARQSNQFVSADMRLYDLNQPVTPEDFSATRAPFAEQSPSLNPGGALAALTSSYARPRANVYEDADDMIVVADVFSNGAASLADVVQAPRDAQMLADFQVALRQSAAFVPASLDRRPGTMRVVFSVQKVDVRDRSF
ncbi:MAG TPA: zf-HC2 domain-containing protein [Pyrinomonadaceae bacterium]|nr:zf-HC2 domain-containing protein [Pyrinomonadaceae bacterium]